jgi:hypothetical protein
LATAHYVLDVAVAEIGLQRPGVMTSIGKRVPAGVPEHVRVGLERQFGNLAGPLNRSGEAGGGEGRTPLRREHEGRSWILLSLQPPEAKILPLRKIQA